MTQQRLLAVLLCCSQALFANCPSVHELSPPNPSTGNMRWESGLGGWHSDNTVVMSLSGFKGAQWRGTNVGQIACIYQPAGEATNFPLVLYNGRLAPLPSQHQGRWVVSQPDISSEKAAQVANCVSDRPEACPFEEISSEEGLAKSIRQLHTSFGTPLPDPLPEEINLQLRYRVLDQLLVLVKREASSADIRKALAVLNRDEMEAQPQEISAEKKALLDETVDAVVKKPKAS